MRPTKPFTQWTGQDFVDFLKSFDRDTWIKIGIVFLILALFAYFIAIPAWFKRGDLALKSTGIEGQIIRLQTLKRNEKKWIAEKESSAEYTKAVKARLYRPGETSLLLGLVSKLADENNVSIFASKPREDETIEFPEPYSEQYYAELYDFGIEGGYHDIGRFMSAIESYNKILRVEAFRLNAQEDSPERHVADLTVSVITFKGGENE